MLQVFLRSSCGAPPTPVVLALFQLDRYSIRRGRLTCPIILRRPLFPVFCRSKATYFLSLPICLVFTSTLEAPQTVRPTVLRAIWSDLLRAIWSVLLHQAWVVVRCTRGTPLEKALELMPWIEKK